MNMRIATEHLISAWTKGTKLALLGLGLLAISLAVLLPVVARAAVTTYTSRSAWQAAAGTPTTINFSTLDNGAPITNPADDAFFPSLTLSGVTFLNIRSYWNQEIYVRPNQPLRANLPSGTVAFGADLAPFYMVPGSYTITLSTGETFTHSPAFGPGTWDFFGVVFTTPVEWVEFKYDNTYLGLDNFSFIVSPAQTIQNLINTIYSMGLPNGVTSSLTGPLGQASVLLNDNNPNNDIAACGKLNAFISQVNSKLSNGQLTPSQANLLLLAANAIKASLGCP